MKYLELGLSFGNMPGGDALGASIHVSFVVHILWMWDVVYRKDIHSLWVFGVRDDINSMCDEWATKVLKLEPCRLECLSGFLAPFRL